MCTQALVRASSITIGEMSRGKDNTVPGAPIRYLSWLSIVDAADETVFPEEVSHLLALNFARMTEGAFVRDPDWSLLSLHSSWLWYDIEKSTIGDAILICCC